MAFSTVRGFINKRDQTVLGPTGLAGTDHGQTIYVLSCGRCDNVYGANGSDIAGRRCPKCDGGAPGFEVSVADILPAEPGTPRKVRNPNWTRDELILALDLYFDHPTPDQTHPEVIALSEILNRFWAQAGGTTSDTLRNPSGVSMKLSNFQRFDPKFQGRGAKGLANGGKLDLEVWNEFSGDRARLRAVAHAIRTALDQTPGLVARGDESEDAEAAEGAVLTRLHHYRERDRGLVQKRKEQELKRTGRLACEACAFEFRATYGPHGEAYIEAHHTRPVETLGPDARTKVSELALLCANCHRMVHAKRPWLSIDELKRLIQAARTEA
jgi:5-methylcytosine-specific restriction protein A